MSLSVSKLIILSAAVGCWLITAQAHAVLIDDFSIAASPGGLAIPGISQFFPGGGAPVLTTDPGAGINGSARDGTFNLFAGLQTIRQDAFVAGGSLVAALTGGADGSFMLMYGPSLAANLQPGPEDRIRIDADLDAAAAAGVGTDFTLTLEDSDTTHTLLVNSMTAGAQNVDLLFASFSDPGNLDPTAIDKVTLMITPATDGDLTIRFVESTRLIPEPSTSVLATLGLFALGFTSRRRRRRA